MTSQLTLTSAVPILNRMSIYIQKHARYVFKVVQLLYVTVNVKPYGTVRIVLCNKTFLTLDVFPSASKNVHTERCLTALRCAAARLAAVAVFIACPQAFPALRLVIVTCF
jgi:hypothetical protein